jgi:hypothetical protein
MRRLISALILAFICFPRVYIGAGKMKKVKKTLKKGLTQA